MEFYIVPNLKEAISCGNLDLVQRLVSQRDASGVPLIDLNRGFGNAGTALMWALWADPINIEIIQVLLNIRDLQGRGIINVNHIGPHGQTVFSFILQSRIPATLRHQLLQIILDLRDPNGELRANLQSDVANIPLLKLALDINDINCLRALLDARREDGRKALDVNEEKHGTTVLDVALSQGNPWYTYSQEVVDLIKEEGGLTSAELAMRWAPPFDVERAQPLNFANDNQNTHDPSVTHTAKGSLLALNASYGAALREDFCIQEIEAFIQGYDYNTLMFRLPTETKRQAAIKFLNLLKTKYRSIHSYTQFSIKKVLALVWMGIKEQAVEKFPEEMRRTFQADSLLAPESIINIKKSSFIEKFIEAAREYHERGINMDICEGGSIHKLLEALNHAHVDVVLATGAQSILPAANNMAIAIVGRKLREKIDDEQRRILSDWDEEIDLVSEFKTSIKTEVDDALKRHFGIMLTEDQRAEIVSMLPEMPRPNVPHEDLNALVTIILNTVQKTGDDARKANVGGLHQLARQIYFESCSDQDKFEQLQSEYDAFCKLLPLMIKIHTESNTAYLNYKEYVEKWIADIDGMFVNQQESFVTKHALIERRYCALPQYIHVISLLRGFDGYLQKLSTLIQSTTNSEHAMAMQQLFTSLTEKISHVKIEIQRHDGIFEALIRELQHTAKCDIDRVQERLEEEPGIWRNLHPIIKGFLGILAALLVIPAILVEAYSKHGYIGTFFKKPHTESTCQFKSQSLDLLPKADLLLTGLPQNFARGY